MSNIGKSAEDLLKIRKQRAMAPEPKIMPKIPASTTKVKKPSKPADPSVAGSMKQTHDEAIMQPSLDPKANDGLTDDQMADREVMNEVNKTLGKRGRGRPRGISPKG